MRPKRRKPDGSGFGEGGGSNVAEYIGLAERVHDAERQLEAGERIIPVRVDQIDRSPYQTRVDFDSDELKALAADIRANGLSQPVTLRTKADGRYELVAGERRWRAVELAGLETVEARVRDLDDFDSHLIGVSENNQRANLSPWEKALEALELRQHAKAAGRPHAQRDLARYLNRNVAIVNQQIAIARAITVDRLDPANVDARDVCQLPHETLHRIAKLPQPKRPGGLRDAVRRQQARKPAAGAIVRGKALSTPPDEPVDRWTRFWEQGGFQVHIRKPLRDLDPVKAQSYIQDLLPGIGALAARAALENGGSSVVHWEHGHGRLVFIRPAELLSVEERNATKEALARIIADLDPAP